MADSWNTLADEKRLQKTVAALQANGMQVHVVESGEEAKRIVLEIIPQGSEVMTMTSETLETTGIAAAINEGDIYNAVRPKLYGDEGNLSAREKRQRANAPDWAVGSVHAITEDGHVFIASNTGSQMAAYVYGAERVVWVVSTKKLVKDFAAAVKRIYDFVLPQESERARKAYGSAGSNVSKLLVVNKEVNPERIRIILVREDLGF